MKNTLSKCIVAILLLTLSAVTAAEFTFSFGGDKTWVTYCFGLTKPLDKEEDYWRPMPPPGPMGVNYYFLNSDYTTENTLYKDLRLSSLTVTTWKIKSVAGGSLVFKKESGSIPDDATLALYNANGNTKVKDVKNNASVTLDSNSTYYIQYTEKGKTALPIAPDNVTFSMNREQGKLVFNVSEIVPEGYTLPSGFILKGNTKAKAYDKDHVVFDSSFASISYSSTKGTLTLPSSFDSDITSLEFDCWFQSSSSSSIKSSSGRITVLLTSEPPILSINPSAPVEAPSYGGAALDLGIDFEVYSNVSWTVRSDSDWLVPITTEGIKDVEHVMYTIAPNLSEESRTGHLYVESSDTPPAIFTVTQLAAVTESYTLELVRGWNFITLTHQLKDESISTLLEKYPILTFNQSGNYYEQVSTLIPGLPYWLYALDAAEEQVTGYVLDDRWEQPVIVNGKWSFIGVATEATQPDAQSVIWEWDTAAQSFTIVDSYTLGKAYMIFKEAE